MRKKIQSFRVQIFLLCMVNMFFLQSILLVNYYQNKQMKIQTNNEYLQGLMIQMQQAVEDNCDYLNTMVEKVAYSGMVQGYLETEDNEYRKEQLEELRSFLMSFSGLKYGIKDIAIIDESGNVVNLLGENNKIAEIAGEIPEKKLFYYTGMKNIRFNVSISGQKCFCVGTNVYSVKDFGEKGKMGTVLITFSPQCLFTFMRYQSQDVVPNMIVFDRNGQLVFSSVEDTVLDTYKNELDDHLAEGQISLNGQKYHVQSGKLEKLEGEIVFLNSQKEIMEGVDELQRKLISLSLVSVGIMFLICLFIIRNMITPLNGLIRYMKEMENGDLRLLKEAVSVNGATEVEMLVEGFNKMMREIDNLTHRLVATTSILYESKIEKQQAELEYMRSQINPHFLFNTLESIKGCAVDENADSTFHMLSALGKMFRYCVRGESTVILEEEISIIDSYMALQKIRFGDRLTFHNLVSEEFFDVRIPKMLLQPLLENAVVHGIEENGAITVWMEAYAEDKDIVLVVRDDGVCLTDGDYEQLEQILEDNRKEAHIGMSNVHWRLKYIYGNEYGLILGGLEKGFQVKVRMPRQKKEEDLSECIR